MTSYVKPICAALGLTLIAGCSTSSSPAMQKYVGRTVTEAMIDHGRPAQVYDQAPNVRAFQWRPVTATTKSVNMTAATTAEVASWTAPTTTSKTAPLPGRCLYTLLGERKGDGWTVIGLREPMAKCDGV